MREDEFDRVSRQGAEAWRRLKKDKNWNDWLKVGETLVAWREWAMNQAGTNEPRGKGYNMAFGEKLTHYKLDDMDKGDRSRLFTVMDNLPMIEEWRRTLTLGERLRLNHPNAVWRKWKAHIEPEKEKNSDKPTLRDSVVKLDEDNAAKDREVKSLKQRVRDLEGQLQERTEERDAAREELAALRARYGEAAPSAIEEPEAPKEPESAGALRWTGDAEYGFVAVGPGRGSDHLYCIERVAGDTNLAIHGDGYWVKYSDGDWAKDRQAAFLSEPGKRTLRRLVSHCCHSKDDIRGPRQGPATAKALCEADYAKRPKP
jgi:hypothetical protein